MAKNGCSEFFLTIFPKKTGINSEWPKMCILNFLRDGGNMKPSHIDTINFS